MPRHASARFEHALLVTSSVKKNDSAPSKRKSLRKLRKMAIVVLHCHSPGVAWRGLYPLLFESPPRVSNKALSILTRRFSPGRIRIQQKSQLEYNESDTLSTTHSCRSLARLVGCNLVYILPPFTTTVDYAFCSRLIHYEHIWLQMQTLSAYYATLGGGFFLCRRLSTAIQLAQRQRYLALWMSDYAMADRCTLNESYNYLHAGQFDVAFAMLKTLKASARRRRDVVLWNMCKSARLLGKRMKQAGKRGGAGTNVDDYQRIRIVGKL